MDGGQAMVGAGAMMGGQGAPDDDSAANLEASLQSCTAHRDRILQMLIDDPTNADLIALRDQLTSAINQLQGTKNMVRAARSGGAVRGGAGMVGGDRPLKGHSSRKNKPQRCSVCGGIGHKSRTCSMSVTPAGITPIGAGGLQLAGGVAPGTAEAAAAGQVYMIGPGGQPVPVPMQGVPQQGGAVAVMQHAGAMPMSAQQQAQLAQQLAIQQQQQQQQMGQAAAAAAVSMVAAASPVEVSGAASQLVTELPATSHAAAAVAEPEVAAAEAIADVGTLAAVAAAKAEQATADATVAPPPPEGGLAVLEAAAGAAAADAAAAAAAAAAAGAAAE
jgi:hypothetical protein